jgi:alpha-L-fucosidase
VRWVGNERGVAGETCWATLNRDDFVPGEADHVRLNTGDRPGTHWLPAECDVSIRPGWFYHAAEDERVKSPDQLVDLYFKSVGRGASFLLNLPPDRRGQIHPTDTRNLIEFRRRVETMFAHNLALGASSITGPMRGRDGRFSPRNLVDSDPETYWATDDRLTTPEAILAFREPVRFNVIGLREHLPLGQRVAAFAVDALVDGQWQEISRGTSIGARRLLRTADIETARVRLRITDAAVCPAVSEMGLWYEEREI